MTFFNTDFLYTDEIKLQLDRTADGDESRGWLPAYYFNICLSGGQKIGYCDLRIGHNENTYYGGNIGYRIDPQYRGHHYAGKACILLFKLARMHGLEYLIITCNPDNIASFKTCEYAGGKLLEIVILPEYNDMYLEGERSKCIYHFDLRNTESSSLRDRLHALPDCLFTDGDITIRPIRDDCDLWYAAVECELLPEQWNYVNPAGFSIGRAYLHPESNVPCVILHGERPIGYIVLREWLGGSGTSWSYYIDYREQGRGCGVAAAKLAVRILKAAVPDEPVKLSVERDNEKGQRLYEKIGFTLSDKLDGDDLVFIYE